MKKVVIVGGGVSGLVCNYAFKKYAAANFEDMHITVLEPSQVGGEFLSGGLKYIHRTDLMVSMMMDLGLVFSNYTVRGGILLQGDVQPHPKCFEGMDREKALRIQSDHYRKTRLTEPGKHSRRAMNDPASVKPRSALRTDFDRMVKGLAGRANILKRGLDKVGYKLLYLSDKKAIPYDYLVLTIPLWIIRRCVDWYIPHGVAMRLNIVNVCARRNRYARWDYVYTPYTPADAIHRFSTNGADYAAELNGEVDLNKLESDLNFIFGSGYYIKDIKQGLKGHLLPLEQEVNWPEHIAPLGRFAKWDSRATMDVTLEDSMKLAERWFGDDDDV